MKDVLFSAILVRANEALLKIAEVVGASGEERSTTQEWLERGLQGLEERWDPELKLCLDYASEGFGEYFEPFTGKLLGSDNQSWTAAVALDWLASESRNSGSTIPLRAQ